MTSKEKVVIKSVLLAQASNSLAHGTDDYEEKYSFYYKKEYFYLRAIRILKALKHSKISYCQRNEPDQNGYPSTIRYFEWIEPSIGKKVQFSFHNPREYCWEEGKQVFWTGRRDGLENLKKIVPFYFKKGESRIIDNFL